MRPPFQDAMAAALRFRCPYCRRGPVFGGWFNRVLRECPRCGLIYFRESGYFIGGMIITYVLTTAVVVAVFLVSLLLPDIKSISWNVKLVLWMVFGILVAVLLVRPAYSLWLALDFWVEPWKPGDRRRPST